MNENYSENNDVSATNDGSQSTIHPGVPNLSGNTGAKSQADIQNLHRYFEQQKKLKSQMAWIFWLALLSPPFLYYYVASSLVTSPPLLTDMNMVISLLVLVNIGAVLFYRRISSAEFYAKHLTQPNTLPLKHQEWLKKVPSSIHGESIVASYIMPRWFMLSLIAWIMNESVCMFSLVISTRLQNLNYILIFGFVTTISHLLMYPRFNQLYADLNKFLPQK